MRSDRRKTVFFAGRAGLLGALLAGMVGCVTPSEKRPVEIEVVSPRSTFIDSEEDALREEGLRLSVLDGYAAEVNGNLITITDVKALASIYNQRIPPGSAKEDAQRMILQNLVRARDRLIKDELIVAEFDTSGGSVPDQAVRGRMEEVVNDRFGGDQAAFFQSLEEDGLSMEEFREQVRKNIVIASMRARSLPTPVVSPRAVRERYEERLDEFAIQKGIRLRLLLLEAEPGESPEDLLARLTGLRKRMRSGQRFENLARIHSDGPNRDEGGDMGWVENPDELAPAIRAVIGDLGPGDISGPLTLGDAVGLVQLVEENETAGHAPFEAVRDQLADELRLEAREEQEKAWIDRLRRKYKVVMFRG